MVDRMKVIFLDIDGVILSLESIRLNGSGSKSMPTDRTREAFNWLIEQTGAMVVVSSTWRRGRSRTDLAELLDRWGLKCTVIGMTPVLTVPLQVKEISFEGSASRGTEIAKWLSDWTLFRGGTHSFVILDDESDMGELQPRLVKTDFETGLTMTDAHKALEILAA